MKNHEARLRAFLAICGSMRTDDSGGQQPKYRMDTYRIMAEFEKPKVCPAYSSVLDKQSPVPQEHLCCPQRLSKRDYFLCLLAYKLACACSVYRTTTQQEHDAIRLAKVQREPFLLPRAEGILGIS